MGYEIVRRKPATSWADAENRRRWDVERDGPGALIAMLDMCYRKSAVNVETVSSNPLVFDIKINGRSNIVGEKDIPEFIGKLSKRNPDKVRSNEMDEETFERKFESCKYVRGLLKGMGYGVGRNKASLFGQVISVVHLG